VIQIRHTGAEDLIASLAPGSVSGVIADPPWEYGNTGAEGSASALYGVNSDAWVASVLDSAWAACSARAYLAVWCTWPKLAEWFAAHGRMRWRYVTGGCWTKSNGFGVGFHHAGDSEFWLLYVKGSPRPADGRQTNAVHAPRLGHSEKPQEALDLLVRTVAPEGGLILDPFAGESASLARCCLRLGRQYVGAEIDAERHERALRRLSGESAAQARMRNQIALFGDT
jgi:hypothetical protein